ncbi:unknown [Helicoverpa armigera nucleopolyhedrovirus]|uniref:Ac52 n=2 Tax=Helicoverpa armigera nucleopolyhedrovirus TaxID=51313 RepID=Q99H05_9ABAC|nr:hypothetical protein HanGV4gp042 [Helicoverpa armigera nucleopolyhedrovirus G4]NP_203598.1 hypothetical protein [Helicoverpa armigera nucleopolyhedrovirus]AEN03966.1 hypothetical protein [Helicoverpa armigera NPV strain Australia]AXR98031.1 hypothetical protein [Helicoverpa assulta nucleopolyhedrovirus]AAG53785.1 unknown [Helicoverpa armigera nucleopolyhedrovirus G4]AAK96294.1 unknown [Helicoverpa armigera nucleopolyhedrovirus]UCC42512.1 hypothetical protein [Helicoverpa armigera nucleopol
MEFVEIFVKYSKAYRCSSNEHTRQAVFDSWLQAVNGQTLAVEQIICEDLAEKNESINICQFCLHNTTHNALFCEQCFFPLYCCSNSFETDWRMFALLSACYWENPGDERVWRERIRLAWSTGEFTSQIRNNNKKLLYKVIADKCVQCSVSCNNIGETYYQFDYNLFCDRCFFPLFTVISF